MAIDEDKKKKAYSFLKELRELEDSYDIHIICFEGCLQLLMMKKGVPLLPFSWDVEQDCHVIKEQV